MTSLKYLRATPSDSAYTSLGLELSDSMTCPPSANSMTISSLSLLGSSAGPQAD